jgi:hypothetical protein
MRFLVPALICLAMIACSSLSFVTAAAGGLDVELSHPRDFIRVVVVNTSNQSLRVSRKLAEAPQPDMSDLYFDVRDMHGRRIEYSMKVGGGFLPEESDWLDLGGDDLIGRQIPVEWLAEEYDLDKGTYSVAAIYAITSADGRVLQSYRSNTLRVVIETNRHEHDDWLVRHGYLFNVEIRKRSQGIPVVIPAQH